LNKSRESPTRKCNQWTTRTHPLPHRPRGTSGYTNPASMEALKVSRRQRACIYLQGRKPYEDRSVLHPLRSDSGVDLTQRYSRALSNIKRTSAPTRSVDLQVQGSEPLLLASFVFSPYSSFPFSGPGVDRQEVFKAPQFLHQISASPCVRFPVCPVGIEESQLGAAPRLACWGGRSGRRDGRQIDPAVW